MQLKCQQLHKEAYVLSPYAAFLFLTSNKVLSQTSLRNMSGFDVRRQRQWHEAYLSFRMMSGVIFQLQ